MKYFDTLAHINRLICEECTGTADELAKKIGKSRSMVFIYLRLMRKLGAPILYCRYKRSYCYKNSECYTFGFYLKA